ncbi:ABC transporter ATP-binding protein [Polynucleobacter sp. SHI8]|uniref:ABC transporter ATP-binding protein n=1 Tax=unclassified Polynucleobacter TaxID=2640945 RepID=UPI00248F59CC|nr:MULTISPECIES: ABC transporter ATP-binding protein [unclassified Polynucleobacter]BDW10020.1 ABC transporter ATP-binding protein [Polynucleobacter sp. SHI2]BDW12466.1 ABC transporter ATP-binding protein [Polynucleobacter sp. SHI8]
MQSLNSTTIATLENVTFSYAPQERNILEGLNMSFAKGKLTAVMGGSGCGKTTVLRLLGGQVRANSGKVLFENEDIGLLNNEGLIQIRRKMGMLFQFGALFTDMSVFENVAFPLREHTPLDEQTITDLVMLKLNAVGLRNARDLMPSQISGGMARRVAFARAVALDPPLIMYDEPFAGLDPIALGVTARLIKEMNNALGATSILVTHDVPETFGIADYVYFIANGKIAAEGTPAELMKSEDLFVRQFIDAQPDGPVPFHYPGKTLQDDFGIKGAAS